jgi:pimeloyl-ACP methyl ester carboxylesterase
VGASSRCRYEPPIQPARAPTELVVIKGGSHAIPWTHAAQVNSALLQFIHAAAANTNGMAVGATM